MSSSISAARQALYALLVAQVGTVGTPGPLFGVQVTFGLPDQYEMQEVVAVRGITPGADELTAILGPQTGRREEVYRIDVAMNVYNPTGDALDVDSRAVAIYEAVRAVVLANPTLTGTVRTAFPVAPSGGEPLRPYDETGKSVPGWVCRIDLAVEVHHRA